MVRISVIQTIYVENDLERENSEEVKQIEVALQAVEKCLKMVETAAQAGSDLIVTTEAVNNCLFYSMEHSHIKKFREIAGKYGADHCFDPTASDVGYEIKRFTGKMGADAILETSGSMQALQAALKGLAYGGTIAYVAFAKPFPGGLWLGQEAHYNYGRIVFSRACSEPNPDYPRWNRKRIEDVVWDMLMRNEIDCSEIIDPVVPFEDCAEGICTYMDREPEKSIKLGVEF